MEGAEQGLLWQIFNQFVEQVYRRGLFEIAGAVPEGITGKFGQTQLRVFTFSGHFVISFSRLVGEEKGISFVCRSGDPSGSDSHIQNIWTDFDTAVAMIAEVVERWPQNRSAQVEAFEFDEDFDVE